MVFHSRPTAAPEIVLDLSRLLSRVTHPTPTGVDRCEMAYARGLLAAAPERLRFAAVHPTGFYGRLPRAAVLRFLDITEERWATRGFRSIWDRRRFVAATLAALRPRLPVERPDRSPRVYVQASPNNLTRPRLVQRLLAYERARWLCLVHDLIPLEYPEYARPDAIAKHRVRVETIAGLADGIVTNSAATMAAIRPWIERAGRRPDALVAHLGTHVPRAAPPPVATDRPYFVCIGTIEPRKNHLLLLNLWRRLVEERGPAAVPRLVVIGRRGWENEQVVDMLERCPALRGCVEEYNAMADAQVAALLRGARALLFPSFAEGYGMPVTEALSLGVPVLCSDLPALREAGGDVPDYLDPLDGPAWAARILDYAAARSNARDGQRARLAGWSPPSWTAHIDAVLGLAETVAA